MMDMDEGMDLGTDHWNLGSTVLGRGPLCLLVYIVYIATNPPLGISLQSCSSHFKEINY